MKTISRLRGSLCAAAFAATFFAVSLLASEEGARSEANDIIYGLANQFGLSVRPIYWKGFLRPGQSDYVTYTLYSGNTYILVAGGCESARDVDLLVYDENWNFITRDNDVDKRAAVLIRPRWTGTFHVKVTMYSADQGGAHWVLMAAYQ